MGKIDRKHFFLMIIFSLWSLNSFSSTGCRTSDGNVYHILIDTVNKKPNFRFAANEDQLNLLQYVITPIANQIKCTVYVTNRHATPYTQSGILVDYVAFDIDYEIWGLLFLIGFTGYFAIKKFKR